MKLSIILPIVVIVLVVAFLLVRAPSRGFAAAGSVPLYALEIWTLRVELADTPLSQTKGLAGVTALQGDEGMLFAFASSSPYGFWMKGMRFPIDIVWFDERGIAVDFVQNFQPNSFPRIVTPSAAARYVLELPAGSVARFGVAPGSTRLGEYRAY